MTSSADPYQMLQIWVNTICSGITVLMFRVNTQYATMQTGQDLYNLFGFSRDQMYALTLYNTITQFVLTLFWIQQGSKIGPKIV